MVLAHIYLCFEDNIKIINIWKICGH